MRGAVGLSRSGVLVRHDLFGCARASGVRPVRQAARGQEPCWSGVNALGMGKGGDDQHESHRSSMEHHRNVGDNGQATSV